MFRTAAVVAFAIVFGACRDAPNPATPSTSYVVDVDVTEALLQPAVAAIAGARVEVIEGPETGEFCLTNALGRCTLDVGPPAVTGTQTPLIRSSKDGFRPATTRFTIGYGIAKASFILTRDSTPDIAGNYDITVTAANSCTQLSPSNRTFSTSAVVSHPSGSFVLFESPAGGKCDYLFGVIRPTGDVELGHDHDCDFPRPPGPVVIVGPPSPRLVTAEGSWTGRVVNGALTLTLVQSGLLAVTAAGVSESCQAPDHNWDFRRK